MRGSELWVRTLSKHKFKSEASVLSYVGENLFDRSRPYLTEEALQN